jgi:hypothetical protein
MSKKVVQSPKGQKETESPKTDFLFSSTHYYIMIAGLLLIVIGFGLMAGGGSDDPKVFNEAIYNFRRIRLAPTFVLVGLGMQIYAILYKKKVN